MKFWFIFVACVFSSNVTSPIQETPLNTFQNRIAGKRQRLEAAHHENMDLFVEILDLTTTMLETSSELVRKCIEYRNTFVSEQPCQEADESALPDFEMLPLVRSESTVMVNEFVEPLSPLMPTFDDFPRDGDEESDNEGDDDHNGHGDYDHEDLVWNKSESDIVLF